MLAVLSKTDDSNTDRAMIAAETVAPFVRARPSFGARWISLLPVFLRFSGTEGIVKPAEFSASIPLIRSLLSAPFLGNSGSCHALPPPIITAAR